jgi:TonB family protein
LKRVNHPASGMMRLVPPFALALAVSAGACASATPGSRPRAQGVEVAPTSCTDSISQDSTVYDTTQVSEKPVLLSAPKPDFRVLLRLGLQGRVILGVIVKANGAVDQSSITIVQRVHPNLDAEARRIIAGSAFWPGCRGGRAVRVHIAIPVDFTLSP